MKWLPNDLSAEGASSLGDPGVCPPEHFENKNPRNAISCDMGIELWASVWLQKRKTLEIVPYFWIWFSLYPPLAPPPPYKSTPDFEVCDYTILPSSTGPCRLKKYAVRSVFKLEFKPQSIPKEARSRLEMPEGSSTDQGHKRPMSREHIDNNISSQNRKV
jgi:hypothetical protein